MSWQFTVGLRVRRKADRIVVDAEDALIAALKVKAERPDATPVCAPLEPTRRHPSPASHPHRRPLTVDDAPKSSTTECLWQGDR